MKKLKNNLLGTQSPGPAASQPFPSVGSSPASVDIKTFRFFFFFTPCSVSLWFLLVSCR